MPNNYEVVKPSETFRNKTYVQWTEDWSNWFYQANPDRNNNGDVIFLRGMPLTGRYILDGGVVMVGNDSLEISEDQRVLVPVITANYVAEHSETPEWLYGMVRSHIVGGDHPPLKEQLRINGQPVDDNDQEKTLAKYEVETPVFMINIPDSSYGTSTKDQMETPIQSAGFFPSVTRGYFVMLKLYAGNDYYIECYATGARTALGPYHVSLLYHIIVKKSLEQKQVNIPPSRLTSNIMAKLFDKLKKGELDEKEFKRIEEILKDSRDKSEKAILSFMGTEQKSN